MPYKINGRWYDADHPNYRLHSNRAYSSRCFATTACCGVEDSILIDDLRLWEEKFFIKTKWGRSFVKWYNVAGSVMANYIGQKYFLKKLLRKFGILPISKIILETYCNDKKKSS